MLDGLVGSRYPLRVSKVRWNPFHQHHSVERIKYIWTGEAGGEAEGHIERSAKSARRIYGDRVSL